jgi:predicted amidophosphoribosyltransferase
VPAEGIHARVDAMCRPVRFGCPVCGLVLDRPGPCRNGWCRDGARWFSVVFVLGSHQGALRSAVARYKYREQRWWAEVFASMIARHLLDNQCWFEDFDFVVPVPTFTGPGGRRSWDHMGEIAEKLDGLIGEDWPVVPGLLTKSCETPPLQGCGPRERRRLAAGPLRSALQVQQTPLLHGSRVLVIDDVLTDGSTLNETARILVGAGASEVAGLVLARPGWRGAPSGSSPEKP